MDFVRAALRAPLLHFAIAAGLLFWLGALRDDGRREVIRISPAVKHRIVDHYIGQYGAPPSAEDLDYLIQRYVREEILYREGLALGLDRDDEIIRRRLAQKMEFLQAQAVPEAIAAADLRRYFDRHRDRYALPETVSFIQVYFADTGAGEDEGRARRALERLRAEPPRRAELLGDPFAQGYAFTVDHAQALRLFGDSPLAAALFEAEPGRWAGPFRSGYGWHLVWVQARDPRRVPALDQVRDAVTADYRRELRDRENDAAFARLRERYTVVEAP